MGLPPHRPTYDLPCCQRSRCGSLPSGHPCRQKFSFDSSSGASSGGISSSGIVSSCGVPSACGISSFSSAARGTRGTSHRDSHLIWPWVQHSPLAHHLQAVWLLFCNFFKRAIFDLLLIKRFFFDVLLFVYIPIYLLFEALCSSSPMASSGYTPPLNFYSIPPLETSPLSPGPRPGLCGSSGPAVGGRTLPE